MIGEEKDKVKGDKKDDKKENKKDKCLVWFLRQDFSVYP